MSVQSLEGRMIGEYRVVRLLGEGGMGVVYEALDERIQRHVAIKLLRPEISAQPEVTARFLQEAVAANQIAHPGIVSIERHGQLEDGSYYLIMEFLRGVSLLTRLQTSRGRLPGAEVIRIARQVASALCAAHGRGIVHRDLKPANLMLVSDPDMNGGERVKVLDFGIAKVQAVQGQAGQPLLQTRANQIIGTPVYMAPEQFLEAQSVGPPADVYALGVILYEALCGAPPFQAEGLGALMDLHLNEPLRPLNDLDPTIAPELADLVQRMLAKRHDERPPMSLIVSALDRLGGRPEGSTARAPSSLSRSRSSLRSTLGHAAAQHAGGAASGSRWAAGAVGGGLALLVAGVGLWQGGVIGQRAQVRPTGEDRGAPAPIHVPAPAPTYVPVPAPAPAPSPPAPLRIRRVLRSVPSGAEVARLTSGEVLGVTPYTHEGPAQPGELALVLRRAGCSTLPVALPLDKGGEQKETLRCASQSPRRVSRPSVVSGQGEDNDDEKDDTVVPQIRLK